MAKGFKMPIFLKKKRVLHASWAVPWCKARNQLFARCDDWLWVFPPPWGLTRVCLTSASIFDEKRAENHQSDIK